VNGLVEGLLNLARPWGYVLVGVLAGLEAAAFVGLVIPGETAMLLGGVLAFTGRASLPLMMACGVLGAIIGDSAGYELGRRFGDPLRRSRLGRRIKQSWWERAEEYVRRRGGPAVFLGRFVGVLRALVPFVAGASRMPYRTFLPFNALGALTWAPGFVYLGFLAGHSYQRVERLAGRASLLLGIAVVLLAALAVAARWGTYHPDRALAPLRRLAASPPVVRLQRRYARQLDFLAGRLNPAAALGLVFTAQLAVLALLGAAFSAVTEDVVTRDELVRLDDPVSRFLIEHREPWMTTVMEIIIDLGTALVLIPLLLAAGVLARWRRGSWRPLGFLALTLAGASLTSTVIKLLVTRPRPETGALVRALGYGFPSGHSTAAAAGWLSTALVLGWLTRSVALRVTLGAGAAAVVTLVGVSRVYLGVHQPTDVLGGWALGALWLAAVLTATHLLTNRQTRPPTPALLPGATPRPARSRNSPRSPGQDRHPARADRATPRHPHTGDEVASDPSAARRGPGHLRCPDPRARRAGGVVAVAGRGRFRRGEPGCGHGLRGRPLRVRATAGFTRGVRAGRQRGHRRRRGGRPDPAGGVRTTRRPDSPLLDVDDHRLRTDRGVRPAARAHPIPRRRRARCRRRADPRRADRQGRA